MRVPYQLYYFNFKYSSGRVVPATSTHFEAAKNVHYRQNHNYKYKEQGRGANNQNFNNSNEFGILHYLLLWSSTVAAATEFPSLSLSPPLNPELEERLQIQIAATAATVQPYHSKSKQKKVTRR